MTRATRVAGVLVMTTGLVLGSAGLASAETATGGAAEQSCLAAIVGGTLADPVGTLQNTLADPVGTTLFVTGCVLSTLGLA